MRRYKQIQSRRFWHYLECILPTAIMRSHASMRVSVFLLSFALLGASHVYCCVPASCRFFTLRSFHDSCEPVSEFIVG